MSSEDAALSWEEPLMGDEAANEVLRDWRTPAMRDGRNAEAWQMAGMYGRIDVCRWLLVKGHGGLNSRNEYGYTPLCFALNSKKEETVS